MSSAILNTALFFLRGIHNDSKLNISTNFACIRHSSPFIFYSRFTTNIPITILSLQNHQLPIDRRIWLQRRGWRCGLLGWKVGGWLGGARNLGIEITPVSMHTSTTTPSTTLIDNTDTHTTHADTRVDELVKVVGSKEGLSRKESLRIQADIQSAIISLASTPTSTSTSTSTTPSHTATHNVKVIETSICHIPASSNDGYFRILITEAKSSTYLASTPTFRISSSSDSGSPRGANVFQVPLECISWLGIKILRVSVWGGVYASFPFLRLISFVPGGGGGGGVVGRVWGAAARLTGVDVKSRIEGVQNVVEERVPWSALGVRRAIDVQRDMEMGRRGYTIRY